VDHSSHPQGENKIAESNEGNNVFAKNIPLPDLRVVSVVFGARDADQQRTADVKVINAGSGSSGAFDMHTEWFDANGEVLGGCIENMPSLRPGQMYTWNTITMCNGNADGTGWEDRAISAQKSNRAVKFRASVDHSSHPQGENKITEANEGNNIKTVDIPLPDLRILNVNLTRNNQGERIANVVIMNSGRFSTPPRFNILSEWLDASGQVINSCSSGAGVASLGVSRTLTAIARSCPGSEADKAVKLKVTVDSDTNPVAINLVAETNESNNSKTISIPLPDLKVEGMNFRGTDKHPEVTVINSGAVGASIKAQVTYEWYDRDGVRLGACYDDTTVLGRNKRYTQKNVFCGNADSYQWATKFKATVDIGNGTSLAVESEILESNENNNALESPIPGRQNLVRVETVVPSFEIIDVRSALPTTPNITIPDEVTAPVPTIDVPETPVVEVPEISNTPVVTVPIPEPVVTPLTPVPTVSEPATVVPTPEPVVEDKYPSYTVEVSDDGWATYTVNGSLKYYGTKKGCTGPRYFDPIIVRWGEVNSHPILDSNNNFTASHKYLVKNSDYNLSIFIINSCFQSITKSFVVHPKLPM